MKDTHYQYLSAFLENTLNEENVDLNFTLEELGYVNTFIDGTIECITPQGHQALADYERTQDVIRQQRAAQRAEEERRVREKREDRRHSWKVAILGAIVAGTVVLLISKYLVH